MPARRSSAIQDSTSSPYLVGPNGYFLRDPATKKPLIADALSMGSSGYLAAKSEQEVYENEIAMERDEIALMPEVERDELALIYEAKGMAPEVARARAAELMKDPERMLAEKVQEELKIGGHEQSPWREAWVTGLATAVGALIPVAPFFFMTGTAAIALSFTLSMGSHFLVGAARSVFTGRGVFRSGIDMFVVGLGVAIAGLIGTILTMTMLIFTALSVTREIERGTMESLLSMPITPVEINADAQLMPINWSACATGEETFSSV